MFSVSNVAWVHSGAEAARYRDVERIGESVGREFLSVSSSM